MVQGAETRDEILERLRGIRLITLDVDGVLTDGGLYYTEEGSQILKFNVKDGLGLKRVIGSGMEVALVTASKSPSIRRRGEVLGIRRVVLDAQDKLTVVTEMADDLGIGLDQVAHIGDDLNDLPVLQAVGCPLAVADAVDAVQAVATYVTRRKGGEGAVREICDLIVEARGKGG